MVFRRPVTSNTRERGRRNCQRSQDHDGQDATDDRRTDEGPGPTNNSSAPFVSSPWQQSKAIQSQTETFQQWIDVNTSVLQDQAQGQAARDEQLAYLVHSSHEINS